MLVAVTVSIAMQVIGVLLVFALLVGPPATAIRLVRRPASAIGSVDQVWGLSTPGWEFCWRPTATWPVSFYITTLAFGIYLPVRYLSKYRMERQHTW